MTRSVTQTHFGTYVGPIAHLRGERAMISLCWPYGRNFRWREPRGLRRDEEIVFVQFNNMQAFRRSYRQHQRRPTALKKHLGYNMHAFKESDWVLDPEPETLADNTRAKLAFLAARARSSPPSAG